jgi:hypothetical protein
MWLAGLIPGKGKATVGLQHIFLLYTSHLLDVDHLTAAVVNPAQPFNNHT